MNPAMEQEEPGHAEQTPDHSDLEGRTHQTASGEEHSPVDDAFIIPEEHLKQDKLRRKLLAIARSLKKQKQRLKAAQDTLNRRWNKVLDAEGKHGDNRHTKSYPKRKVLPEFDNEAAAPVRPKNNTATQLDQPTHGCDRAAMDTARDLRELLYKKASAARSIYGSRGQALTRDYGHHNDHADRIPVWNQHWEQQ